MLSLVRFQHFILLILPLLVSTFFYLHSLVLTNLWLLTFFLPLLLFRLAPFTVSLLISTWSIGLPIWSTLNHYQLVQGFYFDWINLPFLLLTSLFFPYILLSVNSVRQRTELYQILLILIQLFLVLLFSTDNFFVFYIFFELIAFPMFLLIGFYGSQPARLPAAYKFFLYTFAGSIFMLTALISLYYLYGSCSFTTVIDQASQNYFFFLVFFALAVKIPMAPFHLWLPEAHVEAPTGISVLLAALLLKTSGYGFIRFVLTLFPSGVHFWSSTVISLSLVSIFLGSLAALSQTDMKKTIAYSSVAHMNVCMLGLFSNSILAIQAGVYMMLAHAFVSGGLFTGIGVIYDRYHTRSIRLISGLANLMPVFHFFYFFLILGNFSFPLSGNFAAELMVFTELMNKNVLTTFIGGGTVFFSLLYSIWFFNRVFFGPLVLVRKYQDLTSTEYISLLFCVIMMIWLGLYSSEYCLVSYEDYCYQLNYYYD